MPSLVGSALLESLRGSGPLPGPPEDWLEARGRVIASFLDQDSGCSALGIEAGGVRSFWKWSNAARGRRSLSRVWELHRAVRHPILVAPLERFEFPGGLGLIYPWRDGETLYPATRTHQGRALREDPEGAHRRFRSLPLEEVLVTVDQLFEAHREVARAGWVAVDLYDGCFHYDFARRRLSLLDLDEYRPGPFRVAGAPLPGSRRFRPPEQAREGAISDHRSTVFLLGRAASVLLAAPEDEERLRLVGPIVEVLDRATRVDPGERYPGVEELWEAWRGLRS